jgi:hypothetical protein
MRPAILAGAILALSFTPASAERDLVLDGFTPNEEIAVLHGMATTLNYVDRRLRVEGKPRLYCLPDNQVLEWANVLSIADETLTGSHDSLVVLIAAMATLQDRYRCPS